MTWIRFPHYWTNCVLRLNSLDSRRSECNFENYIFNLVSLDRLMIMLLGECHRTKLMISDVEHRFRWWFGAVRQKSITRAHVDRVLCRHMASLGRNELTVVLHIMRDTPKIHMGRLTLSVKTSCHEFSSTIFKSHRICDKWQWIFKNRKDLFFVA